MARITSLTPADLSGSASSVYETILGEYGPYGNMLAAFAHRPPALEHIFSYLLQSKRDALISKRHLEIALLTASQSHACHYCVSHHAPRLIEEGLSQEAVDRILEDDVPGFDELDTLVRDYAKQVTLDAARVSSEMFSALRSHFSEEQVVELTIRIALCSFFKRFNEALDIQVEDGVALELPAAHPVGAAG